MPIHVASSSPNVYRICCTFSKRKDGLNGLWSAVTLVIVRRFGKVKSIVETTVGVLSIPGIEKCHIKGKLGGVDRTEYCSAVHTKVDAG